MSVGRRKNRAQRQKTIVDLDRKSDLTLGNEPWRFCNVSEDVLASGKPSGGLEDGCLRSPKLGFEVAGGFRGGGGNQI